MTQIVLTEEQGRVVGSSAGVVEVRAADGTLVGRFVPEPSPQGISFWRPDGQGLTHVMPAELLAFLADLKRDSAEDEVLYSTEGHAEMFRALQEEWDRLGGFGPDHALAVLGRLDNGRGPV